MSFLDLVKNRQSCRRFHHEKPVEREKIELCLEAARLAPSTRNAQPWTYVIVDEPELRAKVAKHTYDLFAKSNRYNEKAAGFAVIVTEPVEFVIAAGSKWRMTPFRQVDIGISVAQFCLQATELGIGTTILGYFHKKPIKKLLGVPRRKTIDIIISYGYPEEGYPVREKKRKSMEEMSRHNSYQNK